MFEIYCRFLMPTFLTCLPCPLLLSRFIRLIFPRHQDLPSFGRSNRTEISFRRGGVVSRPILVSPSGIHMLVCLNSSYEKSDIVSCR
ncbi:unnamed protein product [Protopolystoma xenopodis]|uniref:Uncharacterized protein n=1 Tax=Protopolystoma xenopodis TaxID=117903 RepID=A0A3S5BKF4_9PLAT|nr:unnamed protein product [Protopolystoma xenopodis]